jgi:hypothetical protein
LSRKNGSIGQAFRMIRSLSLVTESNDDEIHIDRRAAARRDGAGGATGKRSFSTHNSIRATANASGGRRRQTQCEQP